MVAKRHHFLSQCYLQGFKSSGKGKSKKIIVLDKIEAEYFETNLTKVAVSRNFNELKIRDLPVDTLEKELSAFETQVAGAIRDIETSSKFETENRDIILHLIAMFAIRSPHRRKQMDSIRKSATKTLLCHMLSSKEIWEANTKGKKLDLSYEEFKKTFEKTDFTLTSATETHIKMEFELITTMLPFLYKRKGILLKTSETEPFITCDNPVSLCWKNPETMPPLVRNSPGFGMPDTQIIFPLSRNFSLWGDFEGELEGTMIAPTELVPRFNGAMLINSNSYAYTPILHFPLIMPPANIVYGIPNLKPRYKK